MSATAIQAPPSRTGAKSTGPPPGPSAPDSPRLEDLDGVGPRLAERLRRGFGDDAGFFAAAARLDLDAVTAVEGVSPRRAAELVRLARGEGGAEGLLADAGVRRVADEVLERLRRHAATGPGRDRLRLLTPLADPEEARRRAEDVMAHAEAATELDAMAVRRALRRLRPLAEASPRFEALRLVVGECDEVVDALRATGAHRWASVEGLEAMRHAQEHELVVYVYDEGMDLDGWDHVVAVPHPAALADVVPEAVLGWGEANRSVLEGLALLADLQDGPRHAQEALDALDAARSLASGPADLRQAVEDVRGTLEGRLRERVADMSLSGEEVLAALGSRTPAPLQRALDEVLREGRALLRQATGLDLAPFLPGLPLRVDEEELQRLEARQAARSAVDAFEARQRAARKVAALRPAVEAQLAEAFAFDARHALGRFALEHGLRPARFGEALAFQDSVHLALAAAPEAQRIAYHLGRDARVALLTGANSGGKSTLLEHLAQLVVMARMGLPVVGQDVEVPWVDTLHLVTAKRGLDAGAFETFLKGFLPLVQPGARRLVLVDEVEAVTELEAAGRILGFFVERLAATGSLGVVVTHMGQQVLRHAPAGALRVDGIEASGLDDQDRLVVDRSPKMGHFARSTPELIVRRLAARAKGPDAELYRLLVDAMVRPREDEKVVRAPEARDVDRAGG